MCKKGNACLYDYRCGCEDTDTGAGISLAYVHNDLTSALVHEENINGLV